MPSLYLRASEDRVVPVAASQHISNHLPGLKIMSIDAPHFLLQAAPTQAALAVRAFATMLLSTRSESGRADP